MKPGRRPVILLAEDEAIIAIELADSLQADGFDVAGPFATCADAEKWLKTAVPDAAILITCCKTVPAMRWRAISHVEEYRSSCSAGMTNRLRSLRQRGEGLG
jgi:DNA-binding NarL/FixJ family response regulator